MKEIDMNPHHCTLVAILVRLAVVLGRPTFHHFFHKGCEHGIHTAMHKVGALKVISARFSLVPDVAMIGILIALDAGIEMFTASGSGE
jgi:hypothetical protein